MIFRRTYLFFAVNVTEQSYQSKRFLIRDMRLSFNDSIKIDSHRDDVTSHSGALFLREIMQRTGITE